MFKKYENAYQLLWAVTAALLTTVPAQAQVCVDATNNPCDEINSGGPLTIEDDVPDIEFIDTTSLPGGNDWRIDINANQDPYFGIVDPTPGGDNIIFRIDAEAPENSIRVDDSGNVGFGTATPAANLHMVDSSPDIRFHDKEGPQVWKLIGDELGFDLFDDTTGTFPFSIEPGAPEDSLSVESTGNVGLGTSSPDASLHVKRPAPQVLVEETSNPKGFLRTQFRMVNNGPVNTQHETGAATWRQQFQDNAYTLTKNGTGGNEMTIIANTGDMTVRGSLTTGGPVCGGGCDELFSPAGEVESIEYHAASMWENGHLPGVGPTQPDQPMNLSQKVGGLINELEKAHIYIERLHEGLKDKDQRIRNLERRLNDKDAEFAQRLSRLEVLVSVAPAGD